MKKVLFSLLFTFAVICTGRAQQSFGNESVFSPEINPDGTVTFRLKAPKAISVKVKGDFLPAGKTAAMTEGRGGVWSYTTGVLEPELYLYNFYVDEMRYLDPANSYICRDIATWTNYFIISKEPGDKGSLYLASEVPHGTVTRVWYDSPTLKMNRRMTVYTPAGYEDSKEKYPVLYLCHGAGGDEEAWVTLGRTAQIMDNLIAAGLAKKMIVVMPNGNTHCEAAPGEWGAGLYRPSGSGANPMIAKGEASMDESFPDIVNYIEKHYRVLKGKDNRAMCGLSMGGGHTFQTTKRYPDMFSYIGLFSASVRVGDRNDKTPALEKMNNDKEFNAQMEALFAAHPKYYWIAIGKDDFLYEINKDYRAYLDSKGFPYEYYESEGGHIWRNWRVYLTMFAQKLFK